MLATIDPHSPGKYRVNGTVSNMPEFREAYHCKPDAAMVQSERVPGVVVVAPASCRLWRGHLALARSERTGDAKSCETGSDFSTGCLIAD